MTNLVQGYPSDKKGTKTDWRQERAAAHRQKMGLSDQVLREAYGCNLVAATPSDLQTAPKNDDLQRDVHGYPLAKSQDEWGV